MAKPRKTLAGTILSGTTRPGVKLAKGYSQQFDANGKPIGFVKAGINLGQGQTATFDQSGRATIGRGQPPIPGGAGYAFSPFKLGRPPDGYYDVSLNAQEGAANRGYKYLQEDTAKADSRASTDYQQSLGDVLLRQTRGLSDLGLSDTRNREDFNTSMQTIARGFQRQASGQRQSASAAGLAGPGGALLAAARARAVNQGIAEQPVRQGFERATADNATQRERLNTDTETSKERLGQGYTYGSVDRTDALRRAGVENAQFGLDVNDQRWQTAGQMGVTAPRGPSNEFRDANGNPYRVLRQGKRTVGVDPLGKVLWRRAAGVRR